MIIMYKFCDPHNIVKVLKLGVIGGMGFVKCLKEKEIKTKNKNVI